MPSRNEVYKLVRRLLSAHGSNDPHYEVGQSDQALYLRAGPQVFRITVEELTQFNTVVDAHGEARRYMQTLPYPPD